MGVEYAIEVFDSGSSFGPGTKVAELWDARNLGWSRYDRIPGKAFCTLAQQSPTLPLLSPLLSHVKIWRVAPSGDVNVFSGGFIDYDSTGDDVVLEFFDYLALLSISRSGFKTLYPKMALGSEIVSPEWTAAKNATNSPLGFVSTGTIEDPVGQDGTTVIKTNQQFGTLDQPRLQLFYDLSEIGRANTGNHVTFAISRTATHTFSFLKNPGTARDIGLVLNGNVRDYHFVPGWKRYRNNLATIGTTSGGLPGEIVASDSTEAAAKGLRQDVFTITTLLGVTGAATEADQQQAVAQRALRKAIKQSGVLLIDLMQGFLEPFTGWDINDTMKVEISNGIDSIADTRRIVGARCIVDESGESLGLYVEALA